MHRTWALRVEGDETIPLIVSGDAPVPAEIDAVINVLEGRYQDKTVIPGSTAQVVRADPGYGALHAVTVEAIPANYGRISWDGSVLTVS